MNDGEFKGEVLARLDNIDLRLNGLVKRCDTRCEGYAKEIGNMRVTLATHKGVAMTITMVISAAVAFIVAWIRTKW